MKTTPRLPLLAALACFGSLTFAALAEDTSLAAAKAEPAAAAPTESVSTSSTVTAAPQPSTSASTSAASTDTSTASAPAPAAAAETPSPSTAAPEAKPELRRIDQPEDAKETSGDDDSSRRPRRTRNVTVRGDGNARVMIFNDAHLGKDESADAVVAIFGNAESQGKVRDAVVAIGGDVRVTGEVGDAVVAVLGDVYVDSKVRQVVSVLGDVELGPNAEVRGDVVDVGGTVKRDPKSIVHGSIPNVGIAPFHRGNLAGLQAYLHECVFKGRPLAFGPNLGWAWTIAIGFMVFYALLALLFRGGVEKCMDTLQARPGATVLTSLLTLLLAPVLIVLLIVTIVGIAVVPFLGVALMFATLFGKAALLAFLGTRITRLSGPGPQGHPAVGVLVGGTIMLLLYTVPVLGFVLYKVMGVLGLGLVVFTLASSSKRDRAARLAAAAPNVTSSAATSEAPAFVPEATIPPTVPPTVPSAAAQGTVPQTVTFTTLPRAGFWIRTAALLIDVILVAVVLAITSNIFPRSWHVTGGDWLLPTLAIYGAVLWKIRGTTIGGIICGLRVVRVDNRPMDWATTVVRALGCFVSLVVAGLGFIWVAIDDEKQSWHDKIAGTTVVLSRGNSLV